MKTSNQDSLVTDELRTLSTVDLSDAAIPSRFWRPESDPFVTFPGPLSWWEDREANCRSGNGYLAVSAPDSMVEIRSMVELLKRIMADRSRPALPGSIRGTCRFVRAPDLYREGKLSAVDWNDLTDVGFLLVANVGIGHNNLADRILPDLFRTRYENGAITFFHLVEQPGDKAFLQRLASLIPKGSYTT